MAASAVIVKGDREVARAFKSMERDARKAMRDRLKKEMDPVRSGAQSRFSSVSPRSAAGFRTKVRTRDVAVQQSLRRTTGRRGDFGAMQMRRALEPELQENEAKIVKGLTDALDDLGREHGF